MHPRLDYPAIAPDALRNLHRLSKLLTDSPHLDERLKILLDLRVSQINGCAYCCVLHTDEAREAGIPQRALDVLAAWREAAGVFSGAERAALAWAEEVTVLGPGGPGDATYDELGQHFSPEEIVDVTLNVTLMNAYNRMAVAFRRPLPPERDG
jgi:AhpD family alkylhydroperoxidase